MFNLGYKIEEISHIFYYSSENECFEKEFKIINEYREKYQLTNVADGGRGGIGGMNKDKTYEEIYGIEKSLEIKNKQSLSKKGKKFNEEHKGKLSKILKEKWRNEEYRELMSKSLRGRKMPKSFCEKQSLLKKGKEFSKEHKEKLSNNWKYRSECEIKNIVQKEMKQK